MLRRRLTFATVLLTAGSLFGQPPTTQEKEVIDWVTRSMINQQKFEWDDWSTAADRRVVLVASETIPVPTSRSDEYGMQFAFESLKEEQPELEFQLRHASVLDLSRWNPTTLRSSCGDEDTTMPTIKVVPAASVAAAFRGEPLDPSVAFVIRISTPALSRDGNVAAVYAEGIGSHVENSVQEVILITRKPDRAGEWDGIINTGQLLPPAAPKPEEREITATDRAVMTAALQWLVHERGEFDLAALTDPAPRPASWRQDERDAHATSQVSEAALAQLARRNRDPREFDTSMFSIDGVRNLKAGDKRVWSRPSVLVSLPAYDGDLAILSLTYRTAETNPSTAEYHVVLRRSGDAWSVVWTTHSDGFIVS